MRYHQVKTGDWKTLEGAENSIKLLSLKHFPFPNHWAAKNRGNTFKKEAWGNNRDVVDRDENTDNEEEIDLVVNNEEL